LVVVGGGPAGHSAAASYRKHGGEGRVVIISADGDAPYQRPPLSKDFLRGESEESALPMESPDFYRENQIELWLADSAIRLDLRSMAITAAANRDVTFDSCVLATGNEPATLPVPGGDHPEVLRLRFLRQARILRRASAGSAGPLPSGSPDDQDLANICSKCSPGRLLSIDSSCCCEPDSLPCPSSTSTGNSRIRTCNSSGPVNSS
jgi:NAD(P)H-nitrite reductase large subunit